MRNVRACDANSGFSSTTVEFCDVFCAGDCDRDIAGLRVVGLDRLNCIVLVPETRNEK